MKPILIIEDEQALAATLGSICRRMGCDARLCFSGQRGLEAASHEAFSLAILDIGLPDISGLDVLKTLRAHAPDLPVVIITAHGSLDNAVAARKLGAAFYLVKPLDLSEVQETLRQALAVAPATPAGASQPVSLLVGAAPALQQSFTEIAHACTSDAPIIITGPTGTGKTLTSRIIHSNSPRHAGPFVALHCSALPESLLEAELFGHEKNAFTGAATERCGHIERAEGGTLFLDEIADISLGIQAKLLRLGEERTFNRVGGREERRGDCRLITATNKDLREEVKAGRFREDLYYRLHVLEIVMPALRERRSDIAGLARYFAGQLAPNRSVELAPETLRLLERYDWPGNIRELRNAVEHALTVASGNTLLPEHLPRELQAANASPRQSEREFGLALSSWLDARLAAGAAYKEMHDELEALALRHLLSRFHNKPTVLARETRMNRVTLRKRCELLRKILAEG
ncbi:MAG: sigma-54 dependent transcriptional regulator [Chthoniobacteraceae bacterium]|nr:sigma-54 dependent transcriptional regulator [Chthoniobacteraceae bacterium]